MLCSSDARGAGCWRSGRAERILERGRSRTWCSAAARSRRREARRLHLCHCRQTQTIRTLYGCTRNQWRNANACWVNQRNTPRTQGAPSIYHLLAILQPVLQSYKHPEDQDAAVGITTLPSTQRRLETPRASGFVGWVHANTERRFTAANSGVSGRENTTASQAAEHPQMFSREQCGPTNLSIFGSSTLTKLCL